MYPYSAPIQAPSGIFYGTASEGGTDNEGTIYSMTLGGTLAVLHCTFIHPWEL